MSSRVQRNAHVLSVLAKAKPAVCKAILKEANKDLVNCLCECAYNTLKGNVSLSKAQKAKLARHKRELRAVVTKSASHNKKKQLFQKGGFLPALLAPLLAPVIAPLAKKVIGKIIR